MTDTVDQTTDSSDSELEQPNGSGFEQLNLSAPLLSTLKKQGYTTPTPIQEQAIPIVLAGEDLMAAAQTGTGKTAGFTLPMLQMLAEGKPAASNQARALVLTPTRELAAQVSESVTTYGAQLSMKSAVVFGGVKINPQMKALRQGCDILVATPGRLMDLYSQNAVRFDELEILVLDEADRMLDMGFIHDIRKILKLLPSNRQTLLFSATFSDPIRSLARTFMRSPKEVSVTPRNATATTVKQWMHPVDKKRKAALLCELIVDGDWQQALVFSRTKHGANKLVKQLDAAGINAAAIHGNKSQGARTKALANFKSGEIRILVATDIAARGLDIDQLPQVVNFDLPNVPEDYVHRIGRTGRAGMQGHALSLVCADEVQQLSDIERLTQKLLERKYVDGFEPDHEVPTTNLRPPKRPSRPKKSSPSGQQRQRHSQSEKPAGSRRRRSGPAKPGSGRPGSGRPGSGRPGSKPNSNSAGRSQQRHGGGGGNSVAPRPDVDGNK